MQNAGDNGAIIETLYRRHSAALVLFAAAIAGDRARAQDAVHQVFAKLLAQGIDHAADAKAYLFASVRNAILNDAKTRRREVVLDARSAWFEPPDRDYAAELRLRQALAALDSGQREVTVLHIWGDLTFAEIGEVLGVSPNTAASRYRYALARLRETMCAREDCHAGP
ncbi:MAG TPA: sigma-70 family RNA polymerase sigma factor [Terriglobia bacterium]|nr:sigma-70 family RNA polymerase sigma factor [Terriglobia bacterium]